MEHTSLFMLISLLILLIVLSAFFSSSEIGVMSLNRYRLRHLVRQKHRRAMRISRMLERPDRLLSVILIGNTFANTIASVVATVIMVHTFGEVGVLIGTIGLALIILIFAEIAPKTVAALYPQRVAFAVSWILDLLYKLLLPLVWLTNHVSNGLLRLLGVKTKREKIDSLTSEELRTVVYEAGGLIPDEHKDMLLSILDLENVTVDDIMVPRNKIHGIDLDEPMKAIISQLQVSRHTRLPIYTETIDNVQGILHARSMINLLSVDEFNKDDLLRIADPCYFVPDGTPLHTQLLNFKQGKRRAALVVDEYGDIMGLVTMEDILEEIVGEFTTDFATLTKDVIPQADGSVIVAGSAAIRELNRSMSWELPTQGPKTLSGLITEYLQYIPPVNICLMINRHPIEVMQIYENQVKTVRIFPQIRA